LKKTVFHVFYIVPDKKNGDVFLQDASLAFEKR